MPTQLPPPVFITSREDLQRLQIPKRSDVPTMYGPVGDYLMVVPLPDQNVTDGGLVLPDRHVVRYNEGHIVEMGPRCTLEFQIGDCVTWNQNTEYALSIENVKFILVREVNIFMRIPVRALTTCPEGGIYHCPICGGTKGNECPHCDFVPPHVQSQTPREVYEELGSLGHKDDYDA